MPLSQSPWGPQTLVPTLFRAKTKVPRRPGVKAAHKLPFTHVIVKTRCKHCHPLPSRVFWGAAAAGISMDLEAPQQLSGVAGGTWCAAKTRAGGAKRQEDGGAAPARRRQRVQRPAATGPAIGTVSEDRPGDVRQKPTWEATTDSGGSHHDEDEVCAAGQQGRQPKLPAPKQVAAMQHAAGFAAPRASPRRMTRRAAAAAAAQDARMMPPPILVATAPSARQSTGAEPGAGHRVLPLWAGALATTSASVVGESWSPQAVAVGVQPPNNAVNAAIGAARAGAARAGAARAGAGQAVLAKAVVPLVAQPALQNTAVPPAAAHSKQDSRRRVGTGQPRKQQVRQARPSRRSQGHGNASGSAAAQGKGNAVPTSKQLLDHEAAVAAAAPAGLRLGVLTRQSRAKGGNQGSTGLGGSECAVDGGSKLRGRVAAVGGVKTTGQLQTAPGKAVKRQQPQHQHTGLRRSLRVRRAAAGALQ